MQAFNDADYAEQEKRLTRAGRHALADYGLAGSDIQTAAYVNNAVFKVVDTDGKRYALRLHRPGHKRAEWIQSELIWLEAIRQQTTLPVPQPVRTPQGALLTYAPVEGLDAPIIATLFGWLEGTFYGNDTIRLEMVRQAGAFLAHLHDYAATFSPPRDFSRPRLDWEGLFGEHSAYNPGEGARIFTAEQQTVFAAVEARVRSVMEAAGQQPQTFGLIHADFIAKNWLFHDGELWAIDFDDCSWGYYLYDLAPALLQFKYEPRYQALREAFLGGYGAIRALSGADEITLETFIAARHLASCRWLAGNLHNPRIRARAADLIAQRTDELRHFLDSGSIDEGGRKEFF